MSGAEIIGLVSGVLGIVTSVIDAVERIQTRYGNHRDNKGKFGKVTENLKTVEQLFLSLRQRVENESSDKVDETVRHRIKQVHQCIESSKEKLNEYGFYSTGESSSQSLVKRLRQKAQRVSYANRLAECLDQLDDISRRAAETVSQLSELL